jgi:hypothetical protein
MTVAESGKAATLVSSASLSPVLEDELVIQLDESEYDLTPSLDTFAAEVVLDSDSEQA